MFCQLFSLQNKSFLCLQHVENKGFQTVIKHRLKAIQKPIKNELGNREKNTKNAHFVLKKCTFRFRDYICSENTDIVINQWGLPFLPALTLKKAVKGLGIKVIAVYHNDPSTNGKLKAVENILEKTRNPLKKMLFRIVYGFLKQVTSASMRYVYHSSDRYVVLSKSFIGGFRSFTGLNEVEKLSVITNPVTVDEVNYEFDFSSKRKEILFVGRIDCNQKKVNRVIDTWALLEQRYPDWRLTIVGDGPDRENLEKQVRELKLRNVSFEGFQNPREYYERASILLLTSEFEGFPLVLQIGRAHV